MGVLNRSFRAAILAVRGEPLKMLGCGKPETLDFGPMAGF